MYTGTRAKLFTWPSSSSSWSITEYTPEAEADEELLSTNPGISSYAGGTDGLEGYIDELLTQAARPRLRRLDERLDEREGVLLSDVPSGVREGPTWRVSRGPAP